MKKLNFNPLLKWISWRINKNKNCIIIFNGGTGSGKSWGALSLASEVAKEMGTSFSIARNVSFNFIDLLKKTQLPGNDKAGTCFLMEEVGSIGSGGSSKEWMSKANAFFNSFMQTTRHRQQILILTCPSFSNLDASTRRLVHCQVSMLGIDYNKNKSRAKPYVLQINDRTGKIYFKYLRFKVGEGKGKLKILTLGKPDKRLIYHYENIKSDFTTQLNQFIISESENRNKPKPNTKVNKENIYKLIEKGLKVKEIASIMAVSDRTVKKYRRLHREGEGNAGAF